VTKTYLADVARRPSAAELARLRAGVEIEGKVTAPAEVRLVSAPDREGSRVEIVIHEGRKRQVRHMLAAVGHPVQHLIRSAIGPVSLGSLKSGQFRMLSPSEVKALREEAERGPEHAEATQASQPSPSPRAGKKSGSRPGASAKPVEQDRPDQPAGRGRGRRASADMDSPLPAEKVRGRGHSSPGDTGAARPERFVSKTPREKKPKTAFTPSNERTPRGRTGSEGRRSSGGSQVVRRDDSDAG
jgi:hypothetical protein